MAAGERERESWSEMEWRGLEMMKREEMGRWGVRTRLVMMVTGGEWVETKESRASPRSCPSHLERL